MTVTRTVWGFIEQRDHRLMRRMNRWRAPRWIRYWMIAATRMGDGWLWYALGAMLLLYGGPQRFAAIGTAGSSAILGIFVFKLLKRLSQRSRPCQLVYSTVVSNVNCGIMHPLGLLSPRSGQLLNHQIPPASPRNRRVLGLRRSSGHWPRGSGNRFSSHHRA